MSSIRRGKKRPNKGEDDTNSTAAKISRFFLPSKRQRAESQKEAAEPKSKEPPVIVDLLADDSDNDEDNQSSSFFKDAVAPKDTESATAAGSETDLLKEQQQSTDNDYDGALSEEQVSNTGSILVSTDCDTATKDICADETKADSISHDESSPPVNPFEMFAFSAAASSASDTPICWVKPKSATSGATSNKVHNKKDNRKVSSSAAKSDKKKNKTKQSSGWVPMKDHTEEEKKKIVIKWQTMADPAASLEDQRFQVLVAARLHARCQDGPVRKAMKELQTWFGKNNFTVQRMASVKDPKELQDCIKNLQYYITKAGNLVKAAQEIKMRFGARVPEDEHSLKQITGIGPVLADVLAYVNTRARHRERQQSKVQKDDDG